jgi:site-specific DNA-cytosine methylase
MIVLSLFDGISCGRVALSNLGINVDEYYASEVDKNAIKISQSNWDDIIQVGDVSKVSFKNGTLSTEFGEYEVGCIDLILAGSPCQGFSYAGKQLNFEDPRSKLYFEFTRILKEVKPTWFLLENVKMKPEFEDIITHDLGCWPIKINSRAFSAQNRLRYYWTNIITTTVYGEHDVLDNIFAPKLSSILEDKDCIGVYTIPRGYNKGGIGQMEKMPCITTSSWQHNFFVVKADGSRRKFTSTECERAQGLPDNCTDGVSNNARYVAIGNCWNIPSVRYILKNLPVKSSQEHAELPFSANSSKWLQRLADCVY